MLSAGPDHFVTPNARRTIMIKQAAKSIDATGIAEKSNPAIENVNAVDWSVRDSNCRAPLTKKYAVMATRDPTTIDMKV